MYLSNQLDLAYEQKKFSLELGPDYDSRSLMRIVAQSASNRLGRSLG
jgi:hypothetical protein